MWSCLNIGLNFVTHLVLENLGFAPGRLFSHAVSTDRMTAFKFNNIPSSVTEDDFVQGHWIDKFSSDFNFILHLIDDHSTSENGLIFLDLCQNYNLKICNSRFVKVIRRLIWYHSNRKGPLIGCILMNHSWNIQVSVDRVSKMGMEIYNNFPIMSLFWFKVTL